MLFCYVKFSISQLFCCVKFKYYLSSRKWQAPLCLIQWVLCELMLLDMSYLCELMILDMSYLSYWIWQVLIIWVKMLLDMSYLSYWIWQVLSYLSYWIWQVLSIWVKNMIVELRVFSEFCYSINTVADAHNWPNFVQGSRCGWITS